eukprot:1898338-Pyramimonas_sp.AAC.1
MGASRAQQLLQPLNHRMPRGQQQFDALLERARSYARIAEQPPGNIGDIFSRCHRAETVRVEANAGEPANNVWSGDPQPTETAALLVQNGGSAS